MKTQYSLIVILLCTFSGLSWSDNTTHAHKEHSHSHDHHDTDTTMTLDMSDTPCTQMTTVKVNGLVCDFCARALEKVFGKRDEVTGIQVDLDKGQIAVATKPGKSLDDATLTRLITNSGYNVVNIDNACKS